MRAMMSLLFKWNLQNFICCTIAVHDSRFGMPACAVVTGQQCFETEMRGRFRCSAVEGSRKQTEIFTVHSLENGIWDKSF